MAARDNSKQPKDTVVKGPDTPVPNDRQTWEPTTRPGETNQDPLGAGNDPSNAVADPTDNRALGSQSARNVTVAGERQSPSNAGTVPGLTPTAALPIGAAATTGAIRGRKIEMLKGETVRLTAGHYINDEYFEEGAILEDYTGPRSANMVLVGKDEYSTAEMREQRAQQQATFRRR